MRRRVAGKNRSARHLVRDGLAGLLRRTGWSEPGSRRPHDLFVATFHRVLPEAQRRQYPLPGLVVTPEELSWFLAFFQRHFSCGTLREAAGAWEAGERPARPWLAVTFDDGQRDNFEHARPVLARAGLRASFYVPSGHVGCQQPLWHDRIARAFARLRNAPDPQATRLAAEIHPAGTADLPGALETAKSLEPVKRQSWLERAESLVGADSPDWDGLMSWEQLAQLARDGHEIGSHSVTHALLPQLGAADLEREVAGSKRTLEERLGIPVDSFCYPNGSCDDRCVEAVRGAGYRRAVTTTWGSNAPGQSPFALRRCDMDPAPLENGDGRPSEALLALRLSGLQPGLR